ncbi:hypothetical protein FN846DRAFT_514199 [Sphaerosporella brunnea]|uniref:Uncharacterized protein n=1 Tax=Sphaerosporella brunnea TaxID=1250544 RepID=A0A5J5EF72_9PEZI|nr:hypothetical protein FN846DRAFT_514199 [Sphaerosporella brunnea]
MSPNSNYHRLSTALDAFVDSLPHQLEFSPNTLQVHFSTRSSSSYAVLHITLFLARLTLERKCLPDLPFLSPLPLGPADMPNPTSPEEERFYAESAERYLISARDLVTLISSLEEWNARIESPFIIAALERAARAGLYVHNFPWMDRRGCLTGISRISEAEPLGTGEETRKAMEFISSLKARWGCANESMAKLMDMQACLHERTEGFIRQDPHDGRILADKMSRIALTEERNKLFSMLMPPTPKAGPATIVSSHGRGPSSDVDTLLLAATGGQLQEPVIASGGSERWMAVNTPMPTAPTQRSSYSFWDAFLSVLIEIC